jgi:P pilus assembly chaperone PapD
MLLFQRFQVASRRAMEAKTVAVLALMLSANASYSGILLNKIIIEFPHDEPPRQDLSVINESDAKAFVKVEVLEVSNPGELNEERISLAGYDNPSFIASPTRMVIGPKGRKQLRLVSLNGPGEVEQVYRVNVTPVEPPLEGEEGAQVKVVIAYQALAIVHPAQPQEKLEVTRSDNALNFVNAGNSYVMLSDGQQCKDSDKQCVDLPSRRLYAGNEWSIALPYNTPVSFVVSTYKGMRREQF